MVVGGAVTLPAFVFFEINYATHPVMPTRLLRDRNVFVMCVISLYVRKCFDFLRGKLTGEYIQFRFCIVCSLNSAGEYSAYMCISFYLTFTQLYGFIAPTTNWSYQDIIYYTNCQSLSLTVSRGSLSPCSCCGMC